MAGTMYALKPVFNLDASVDLPECMYKLPILQVSKSLAGGSDHEELPPGILAALEARQESILSKLASLREELNQYRASIGLSASPATAVKGATADVVIRCSPTHPAYALPAIVNLLSAKIKVHASCHTHSSVASLPPALSSFLPLTTVPRGEADLKITLIWSQVGRDCELMVTPVAQSLVKGEVNLLRYLARLFPGVIAYEDGSSAVDNLLDGVTGLLWALPKDRQPLLRTFAFKLEKSSYLGGESLNLADLALFSAVKQLGLDRDLQPEFRKWFTLISSKLTGQSGRRHRQSSSRKSWRSSRHSSRRYSEKEKTPQRSPHSGHPNHHKKGPSPDKKVHYEKPKQAAPAETKRKHKEATPTKATDGNTCGASHQLSQPGKQPGKCSALNLDHNCGNAPGSRFTRQWPEMRHVFQCPSLALLLNSASYLVSEKLDGSNLAVTSRGVIASRRTVLLNRPTAPELNRYKFSGVTLAALGGLADKLVSLEQHMANLLQLQHCQVECIVYGELIQRGTATSTSDKFNYRERGMEAGSFQIFGAGLAFPDRPTDAEAVAGAKAKLLQSGYVTQTAVSSEENGGGLHLVLLLNPVLRDLLLQFGLRDIVQQEEMSLEGAAACYVHRLASNEIEGIILVHPEGEIYKWKGQEESYPQMFLDQISDLLKMVKLVQPQSTRLVESFLVVCQSARQARHARQLELRLEKAFRSAASKYRPLPDQLQSIEESSSREQCIIDYFTLIKMEMTRDSHNSSEYLKFLGTFLEKQLAAYKA